MEEKILLLLFHFKFKLIFELCNKGRTSRGQLSLLIEVPPTHGCDPPRDNGFDEAVALKEHSRRHDIIKRNEVAEDGNKLEAAIKCLAQFISLETGIWLRFLELGCNSRDRLLDIRSCVLENSLSVNEESEENDGHEDVVAEQVEHDALLSFSPHVKVPQHLQQKFESAHRGEYDVPGVQVDVAAVLHNSQILHTNLVIRKECIQSDSVRQASCWHQEDHQHPIERNLVLDLVERGG